MTETIDTDDIQGLLLRGYGTLPSARFLLLEVIDPERARGYLRELAGRLNLASQSPETCALQIAFTAQGLAALGVPKAALATFAREFLEGADDDIRAETLGDRGDNDPSTWEWGRRSEPIHALLMVYAANDPTLETQLTAERKQLDGAFHIRHEKKTTTLPDQKEHFGWRDGVSMPKFEGVPQKGPKKKEQETWTDPLPPGEFILGYPNDYGAYSEYPTADVADDPANHLPKEPGGTRKDLGRNGTYLVYREMTQNVLAFWDYLAERSREPGTDAVEKAIALGAKMVGRWPSGAPLTTSPVADQPDQGSANEFKYGEDLVGLGCPRGAHIRRANPRDVLAVEDRGAAAAEAMARKHQMIRRGRAFGDPVSKTMDPREILAARGKPDTERRGLHFICLVGNISRQFEFVQRAWLHSANFDALSKDGDPIAAARRAPDDANANDEFTLPATPVRRKYRQMPQFTRLVGANYFFLPGIRALRFISRAPA